MSIDLDRIEEARQRNIRQDKRGCMFSILCLLLAVLLLFIFYGCTTTRYVPVIEHRTDTVQITKQQRDSIWLHDSIYMHEYQKGDTCYVLRDRWRTKYIESISHDTTYISTRDTIPQPYPVEVEVEKKLSWWQRFRLSMANIILWGLLAWGVAWGIKLYWKKFL